MMHAILDIHSRVLSTCHQFLTTQLNTPTATTTATMGTGTTTTATITTPECVYVQYLFDILFLIRALSLTPTTTTTATTIAPSVVSIAQDGTLGGLLPDPQLSQSLASVTQQARELVDAIMSCIDIVNITSSLPSIQQSVDVVYQRCAVLYGCLQQLLVVGGGGDDPMMMVVAVKDKYELPATLLPVAKPIPRLKTLPVSVSVALASISGRRSSGSIGGGGTPSSGGSDRR